MRNVLFIMSFLLASSYSLAQGRIEYEYDEAGNRICQSCVMPMLNKAVAKPEYIVEGTPDGMLQTVSVDVYPNPTSDYIHVTLKGDAVHVNYSLSLCTSQGTLLFSEDMANGITDLNLADYPSGIYLLNVVVGGKNTICKVLKQ